MLTTILLSAGLLSCSLPSGLEEPVLDSLHAVTITADKGLTVSRKDTLDVGNVHSVSEILLKSSAVHVGDNGGHAGLKTVSLRGFGSAHTAIYVDGLRVGNVQSGQNDLGMIAPENVGPVVVDYAQNSISFNTARPVFENGPLATRVSLSGGSFGTWQPYARFDFRLSENLSLSANTAGLFSKGDFSYGDGLVRDNNDVSQVRAGLDLFGKDFHVKAYFNGVERGTPGSTAWPSEDRQADRNAFVQGVLNRNFSSLYTLHLSGKASYDDIFYSSSYGDSRYGQTEIQLNSAHNFQIRNWWKLSLAADVQWDGLNSSNYNASRLTAFSALASSFRAGLLSADIALEYNGAFDHGALSRHALAPSLMARLTLPEGLDISAFARRAYRVPTFNELYYVGYGNPDLRPEDAWLTDMAVDYVRPLGNSFSLKSKLDVFLNLLTDKITSAPTPEDPSIWAPYNIGKVRSAGFDAAAGFAHEGEWDYSLDLKYSYQSAVDRTPDSYSYGQQIPYIARHVVVLSCNVTWNSWTAQALWQMRAGRKDGTGDLPDWNTLDVDLAKPLTMRKAGTVLLKITTRNLLDCRYETVSGYPMPGRSFMAGVEYKF